MLDVFEPVLWLIIAAFLVESRSDSRSTPVAIFPCSGSDRERAGPAGGEGRISQETPTVIIHFDK